jgi:Cu/Ag efflux pump CusA
MIWLAALTFLLMTFLLHAHFKSVGLVAQVMLNIPLAFMGAVFLTWLMVGTISIATLVGLITLAGIASRNTIMMISHYLHLLRHEGEQFDRKMIVRGSLERLVPVTMTALTAALALVPLALSPNEPGKEILYPVAVAILGGLLSSTLLDCVVTPTVFFHFGRRSAEQWIAQQQDDDSLPESVVALPPASVAKTLARLNT